MGRLEDNTLLLLVMVVSLLFGWILWPFSGAILWAVVFAVVFAPLQRRFVSALGGRVNTAALLTLLVVLLVVVLPLVFLVTILVQEATEVYGSFQRGELNLAAGMQQVRDSLPAWAAGLFERLRNLDFEGLRERLSGTLAQSGGFFAGKALSVGQNTLDFVIGLLVMLYLLYFLLRDGKALTRSIGRAIPLRRDHQREMVDKFKLTTRAIVRGTLVVAVVQGALGGLMFWFLDIRAPILWGTVMALLSLLPVVGTSLVWVPVALYLMATGSLWQGLLLVAFGILVIGLVDNLLRPILVGKDTQIPDYVVLITTLGGIAVFGISGFVIGPVTAALFLAAWHVFTVARREEEIRSDCPPPRQN